MSTVGATATTDMSFRWPLAFGRPPLPPPCVATGGGNPSVASTAGVSMRRCFSDQHCNRFSTSLLAELSTKLSCPAAPNVAPMELLSLPCLRRAVHLPLSRTGLAEMADCRDGRFGQLAESATRSPQEDRGRQFTHEQSTTLLERKLFITPMGGNS